MSIRIAAVALLLMAPAACSPSDPQPERVRGDTPSAATSDAEETAAADSATLDPAARREIARGTAGDAARVPESIDWTGGDAAAGSRLYVDHCAVCHGVSGTGDGLGAAALNPKPRDFSEGTFYFDGNANNVTGEPIDLARVIRDGAAAYGGSMAMQAWDEAFSTEQIRDLVAYVRQLSAAQAAG